MSEAPENPREYGGSEKSEKKAEMCGKNDLKKWQSPVDDLFQNLFLERKKLEIEETKVTFSVPHCQKFST